MNKRILLMLMAMIVAVTSWAQEASIGSVKYATFDEAWQAQKPNETIKLLKNVTVTKSYTVDRTRTIDINKNRLTLPENAQRQYLFIVRQNGVLNMSHGQIENLFHGDVTNQQDLSQNINEHKTGVVCALYGGRVNLADVWLAGGVNQVYVGKDGCIKSEACRFDWIPDNAPHYIRVDDGGTFNSLHDMLWGEARLSNILIEKGGNATFYASDLYKNKYYAYTMVNQGTVMVSTVQVNGGLIVNEESGDMTIHNMKYADPSDINYEKPIIDNFGKMLIEDIQTNGEFKHTSITSYSTTAAIRNNQSGRLTIKGDRTLDIRPEIEQKGTGKALINYGIADVYDVTMQSHLSSSTVVGMAGNINFYLDESSLVKNANNSYCLETQGTGKITSWSDGCFFGHMKSDNNGVVLRRGYFNSDPSAFKYQYSQLYNLPYPYQKVYTYHLMLVSDDCEAAINDAPYVTLDEALADAWPGCTVKLLKNVTASKTVSIDQPLITLDLNSFTLSGSGSNNGILDINAQGVKVVNGTLDANNSDHGINISATSSACLDNLLITGGKTGILTYGKTELGAVQFDGPTEHWIKAAGEAEVLYAHTGNESYKANRRSSDTHGIKSCVYATDNAKFASVNVEYEYSHGNSIIFEADGNASLELQYDRAIASGSVLSMKDDAKAEIVDCTLNGSSAFANGVICCNDNKNGGKPSVNIRNSRITDINESGAAIYMNGGEMEITGRSSLVYSNNNAVYITGSAKLDIKDGEFFGMSQAIVGYGSVNIYDGFYSGGLSGTGVLVYGGYFKQDPSAYKAANREVEDRPNLSWRYYVRSTEEYEDYGLILGGKDIKSHNCSDIFGDGTAKFDPETKTLTLDNAHIPADRDGGEANLTGEYGYLIKVELIGDNVIEGSLVSHEIQFVGNGTLTITGGVTNYNNMYINGPEVTFADGIYFWTDDTSALHVYGTGKFVAQKSGDRAVMNLSHFVPGDHIGIVTPDATFDDVKKTFVGATGAPLSEVEIGHVADTYGLVIEGNAITSDNLSVDISNGGTATYDPDTSTLTLWNVNAIGKSGNEQIFLKYLSTTPLTIMCCGTNTINNAFMYLGGYVTLMGEDENATLTLDRNGVWPYYIDNSGICLNSNSEYNALYIKNLSVTIKDYDCGIRAYDHNNFVSLENATLDISALEAAVSDINMINFVDCGVVTPMVYFSGDKYGFVNADGRTATNVTIAPAEQTGITLYYNSSKIFNLCTANAADYFGDGSMCYDAETKTLTLTNADLSDAGLQLRGIENLKVNIVGDNTINSISAWGCPGIVIGGNGNLTIDMQNDVVWFATQCDDMLTIEGINLKVRSPYSGICGQEKIQTAALTIRNANVDIECGESFAALYGISSLTLVGCEILEPQNAQFDAQQRGVVVNGDLVKGSLKIGSTYATGISNSTVNAEGEAYDLLGRRVSDSYRGISIRNGKKMVK